MKETNYQNEEGLFGYYSSGLDISLEDLNIADINTNDNTIKTNNNKKSGRKDNEITTLLIVDYNLKTTLSGKFESYLNLQMHKHEMESLGFELYPEEIEDIKKCEDNFMKAFSKASEKQRNALMYKISDKKIDYAEQYRKEKTSISKMITDKGELARTKINYIADSSAYSIKLKVLNKVEQELVEKKLIIETPVEHNTSMKEFTKLLGLSDKEAVKYLEGIEPKLEKEKKGAKRKNIASLIDDDDSNENTFDIKKKNKSTDPDKIAFDAYNTHTSKQTVYSFFNFKTGLPQWQEKIDKGEILLPHKQSELISKNPDKPIKYSRMINGVEVTENDYYNYPSLLKDNYTHQDDFAREAYNYDEHITNYKYDDGKNRFYDKKDLFFKNVKVDPDEYINAVNSEIIKYRKDPTIEYNLNYALGKKKLPGNKAREIKQTINRLSKDQNYDDINDWIVSDGNDLKDTVNTSIMRGLATDDKARLMPGKGYEKYILLHSGHNAYFNDPKKAPDNFKKALAANVLKVKDDAKFDVDTIHNVAKSIDLMPEYGRICKDPIKLMESLSDPLAISTTCNNIIKKTYGVSADRVTEYIDKMQKVYNSMKPQGKQSTAYRELRTAMEDIIKLKENGRLNTPEGKANAAEAIVSLNAKLLEKSEMYMKGKKAVRGSNEGNHRFNNTLDALGLMYKYAPDSKKLIMVSVDRINYVRKVKPGAKNYVDINKYNDKRAVNERKIMDSNNGKLLDNIIKMK